MGAPFNNTDYVYWRDELKQIAEWIDRRYPGDHCPEPRDIEMRQLAKRLRAIAKEPERSQDGSLLQGCVSWVAEDITDRYHCDESDAEEFLDSIEDHLQVEMIETGWRIIRDNCEFEPLDTD